MLFVVALAAGFAVSALVGGRAGRVYALGLRWWWLAIPAFGLQGLKEFGPFDLSSWAVPIVVGTHLAMLALALRNWRVFGIPIVALGLAMNLAVMLGNGGLM